MIHCTDYKLLAAVPGFARVFYYLGYIILLRPITIIDEFIKIFIILVIPTKWLSYSYSAKPQQRPQNLHRSIGRKSQKSIKSKNRYFMPNVCHIPIQRIEKPKKTRLCPSPSENGEKSIKSINQYFVQNGCHSYSAY